ncbi:ATPase [Motilimonas pumila]|uniref:ATPase n=1 Tax=Motilimonas pumila TaxID=2303987 RepID=A0A418YC02_9GAMM|nr:ATPase [Motilimonas pumila]RJG42019.1 ATPase [Motilimonas pumila]
MKKIALSWSSGKDACLTLLTLQAQAQVEVCALFTTHVKGVVPFQNTPIGVVQAQAQAIGLPLVLIELPTVFPANDVYQGAVVEGLKNASLNIDAVAFGDMFHNGIAAYRKSYIEPAGWQALFPLMGKIGENDREISQRLSRQILSQLIECYISCVDNRYLAPSYCGQAYDSALVQQLTPNIDPCGEHGEFHTIVTNAPCFNRPICLQFDGHYQQGNFTHSHVFLDS